MIKGDTSPREKLFGAWVLDVYHNMDAAPNYQLIATSGVRFNSIAAHSMLIHPTKAVVVLCLMSITVIWRFALRGRYLVS